jgi:hypothetical protein
MSALPVKIVPLLDALQLLMLFVGTLMYLELKLFLLIIFHNLYFLTIKILFVLRINVHIYFFAKHRGWRE